MIDALKGVINFPQSTLLYNWLTVQSLLLSALLSDWGGGGGGGGDSIIYR